MAGLKVITPPANEPVSRSEIKTQLQIESSDTLYDAQIDALNPAARSWCEQYQNRAYITQTLELAMDAWPCGREITMPRPPLQSVAAVEYGDPALTWTADHYIVDTYAFVGRLVRKVSWPTGTLPVANGISVTYTAGYGDDAEDVPATIRQAIILLVIHWFNNGVCDPPAAVYALLDLERVIPI